MPEVGHNGPVSTSREPWVPAGILAGLAGLATSYATAMLLTFGESPFVAVADLIARYVPEDIAERAVKLFGHGDRMALLVLVGLLALWCFGYAGALAKRRWWLPGLMWLTLAAVGLVAVLLQEGAGWYELLPVAVGLLTWLGVHGLLTWLLRRPPAGEPGAPGPPPLQRRTVLGAAGVVAAASVGLTTVGRIVGRSRRHVEISRRLLRLEGVTRANPPKGTSLGVPGAPPWQTPNEDFFVVDTAIAVPTIEPHEWRLRVHGMVERELTLTYSDLVERELTESWITLPCVTNEVGGDLVGNARWSGVPVADVLAEAGVRPGADCVRQVSHDGWDCATPLSALTDGRDALLAVGMNGRPLPIEHGFPVRTIVPGLYGHVSATKWLVELEVTRFDEVETYWTSRDWSERAPARLTSRIDVPATGDAVLAGDVTVAGVAWHPQTGIAAVEVSLDGGAWTRTELGRAPSVDTWVQWMVVVQAEPGPHEIRVRALDRAGEVQSGVLRSPRPDGATGWHTVEFEAIAHT